MSFSGLDYAFYRQQKKRPKPLFLLPCLVLLCRSKASAAVDGAITLGNEGHRGRRSALRTSGLELLTGRGSAVRLAYLAAFLAAGRFVLEAFFRVELLLACGEHEFRAAIAAG